MGIQCASVSDASSRGDQEGMELPTRSVDELSSAILSTMRVELRFKCEGLPLAITGKEKAVVSYKVEYGGNQHVLKWSEKLEKGLSSKYSNAYILPYEMGTNKLMRVYIYYHEDNVKVLYGEVTLNLDEAIMSRPNELKKKVVIVEEAYKEEETYVMLQVSEKKQEALAQLTIQFEVLECRLKGPLYFTCYQKTGEGSKLIYQSEMVEAKKSTPRVFTFHPLMLSSESFEGSWEEKVLVFEFDCAGKKPTKTPTQSTATFATTVKDLIQLQTRELSVEMRNVKFGKVKMKSKNFEPIITLGNILFSDIKFIPIIAVDCSLGNLTFDSLKCMHHFDKIRPNYYIEALRAIESKIAPFYSRMLAYGFGAKIIPKKTKLSSCFSLNKNIFDPTVKNQEELVYAYIKTIKSVELCLPVNYSEIIRTAKELAQTELRNLKKSYANGQHYFPTLSNYYVLYILTAGVLDDPEEAFNECLSIPDLPLSIVFVKIGNQQMKDVDDLGDLKKRLEQYQSQKRKFMSLVEFDRVYNDLENFGKFLISTVPTQVLQFIKIAQHTVETETKSEDSVKTSETFKQPGGIEEGKVIKQQVIESSYEEYFEGLKTEYYQKLKAKAVSAEDIDYILSCGVPEMESDFSLEYFKND
jgi:hypothetical protein